MQPFSLGGWFRYWVLPCSVHNHQVCLFVTFVWNCFSSSLWVFPSIWFSVLVLDFASAFFFDLDHPVIDLAWKVSHGLSWLQSLIFLAPLFCPTILLRRVWTVSLRMSCQWCLEFFSYLLNVCKFWTLVARNDFRLRGKRVMERVKSRVRIHPSLFFPSFFPVWSPSSFLCSSVGTLSTGTRGTTTRYRMWSFSSVHAHLSHSNLSFAILGRQSVWLHVVGKRVQQGNN